MFRPVRISFERDGNAIRTVGSEREFGSAGLTLMRQ
jgi:hypothetical protein